MPINGKQTYYEFFGLENFENDQTKIKKAYHNLALKWHPDRSENKEDAERMMKKVNEIWGVLSKEKSRYDQYLKKRMGNVQDNFDSGETFFTWTGSKTNGWGYSPFNSFYMDEMIRQAHADMTLKSRIKSRIENLSGEKLRAVEMFLDTIL